MNYDLGVVAWATDRDYVERRMALRETAAVHHRRGYKIKLLALSGYEIFKSFGVEELGYEIVDCKSYFDEISKKYAPLMEVFKRDNRGNFFFNNTLRWMVIREFLSGRRVNVDGDLIVNRGAVDILASNKVDFYYPDSTCFVVANDQFFESYIDLVDSIVKSPKQAFDYMKSFARRKEIHHWGLNRLEVIEDLDEERLAAFAIHQAGLYKIDKGKAPQMACPPFIAHATGIAPFGRYLADQSEKFPHGVSYEYRDDTHYFSGFPLCFMHYQEQLHFLLGSYRILDALQATDDLYRKLLTKNFLIDYVHREERGELDAMHRFLWDMAIHKYRFNTDFWDMRTLINMCEEGGLSNVFTSRRWHYENIFTQ